MVIKQTLRFMTRNKKSLRLKSVFIIFFRFEHSDWKLLVLLCVLFLYSVHTIASRMRDLKYSPIYKLKIEH